MHACKWCGVIIAKRTAGPSRYVKAILSPTLDRAGGLGMGPPSVFMIHAGAGAGLSVLVVGVLVLGTVIMVVDGLLGKGRRLIMEAGKRGWMGKEAEEESS